MAKTKQYFGQRRLEKILLHFLADQPELAQDIRQNCKEFGRNIVFQYKKRQGTEWLHCTAYETSTDRAYDFSFCCMWFLGHRCSLEVKNCSESEEDFRTIYSGYAYYDENFYPIVGDTRLCCRKLCKIPLDGEKITLFLTEDTNGQYFSLEPIKNDDKKYLCTLPAVYHIEEKHQRKFIVHNNSDVCVYLESENGIPVLRCSTLSCSHDRNHENFTDSFLNIELKEQQQL